MTALDTNVVVRFLVNDDHGQGRRARELISRGNVFVGATVFLETEWVLRAAYKFQAAEIARFFRALLGLPGLSSDDPERIGQALDGYEAGLDFADALHLAFRGEADSFATFDRGLAQRSRRLTGVRIVTP